ncbi:unnamed protein product [Meloidogyne enterolobii]|uniref:Uncharacterized protein n=1 Tax=Meloidogyne enterolobii TaxID=390850 RepID=A0ACB1AUR2_MELEN
MHTMKNAENKIGNHSNDGTMETEINNSGQAKTSTTSFEIWSDSENEEPEPELENIFKTTLEEAENSEKQKCNTDTNGTLVCEWNGGKKSEKNKSHEIIELENEIHTTTSEIQPEPGPVSIRVTFTSYMGIYGNIFEKPCPFGDLEGSPWTHKLTGINIGN